MKAIRIHAYGGPELMQLEDAPVPACGAGALLVRVVAAGVNPIDWKLRSGVMAAQIPKTFPITLGFDAAGIVTAVGGEVAGFEPRTASFAAAAALPMGGQAAWTALIETGQVERGMRVLIHGAAGALGTTAVQLAKEHGAHVTATASGKGMALVKSLGADEVIDYRTQRFEQVAHDIDVVLDTLGAATQEASWTTMRKGGILVATAMPPSPERAAAAGVRAAFVFTQPRGAVLEQLAERVDDGRLRIVVGQEFALADAARAHRLGEAGKARGKMVLHVGAPGR